MLLFYFFYDLLVLFQYFSIFSGINYAIKKEKQKKYAKENGNTYNFLKLLLNRFSYIYISYN